MIYSYNQLKIKCQQCSLKALCLPIGLSEEELSKLEKLVESQLSIKKSQVLFSEHQKFEGFYIVRSGAFKYVQGYQSHQPKILSFYLPGDFFGLDAVHSEQYPATAIALEDSSVCKVNFDELMKLSQQLPSLQRFIINLMSEHNCDSLGRIIHHHSAEQRLIAFLLELSHHYHKRGFSNKELVLPMARKDIANYLDLATETVSRLFSDLQQKNLISLDKKALSLLDIQGLEKRVNAG